MRSIYTVCNLTLHDIVYFVKMYRERVEDVSIISGRRFSGFDIFEKKRFHGSQSKKMRDVSIERGPFVRSIDILATATNIGRSKGRVLWLCPRWTGWFRGRSRYFGGQGYGWWSVCVCRWCITGERWFFFLFETLLLHFSSKDRRLI